VGIVRVGIDATPLLGRRTGIGRYVEHLVTELAHLDDRVELTATAFSLRGLGALPAALPPGVVSSTRPFPANLLQRSWMFTDHPSAATLGLRRVEVVHGTNFVLPPTGRRQRGVLTVHDLAFAESPELVDEASRRFQVLVPRGLRRADVVLTPSRATADRLCERYGLAPERVMVTPLGVDAAWAEARPTRQGTYLLAVGTVEPRKGLDVLLDALRLLHDRRADVPPLVIVGAQGWGPELDRRGLPETAVISPGWLDTGELMGLVAGAQALVFPSRDEGFGLPPLEAMAAGVPVLASDLPVTREVLGGFARLVPPGDPQALAEGLLEVLQDPRGTAVQHALGYTWRRCAELTATAYEHAAA
jgi:glycosyltransferase involved in cell wall biosynthesis